MNSNQITIKGPGIQVVMDPSQIVPENPGDGQPIYVETLDGKYSSSWNAATCEGELLGTRDAHKLSERQADWLDSVSDRVMEWARANGA